MSLDIFLKFDVHALSKMKKIIILLVLVLFGWSHKTLASHLMGGEITWDCVKTGPNIGKFIFTVKVYRDCNGIPGQASIPLTTNAPVGAINCLLVSQTDISPDGPGCPTCAVPLGYANAVEEFVYRSAPLFLNGVPPAAGWNFWWTSCCRNGSIVNLGAAGTGDFTLRAYMYSYNATETGSYFCPQ